MEEHGKALKNRPRDAGSIPVLPPIKEDKQMTDTEILDWMEETAACFYKEKLNGHPGDLCYVTYINQSGHFTDSPGQSLRDCVIKANEDK